MKNTRGVVIGGAAILVSAIFFLVPFIFIFVIGSMERTQANQLEFTWPRPFVLFNNLQEALAARDYLMVIAFINSFILTVVSVAALVILSAMVAYIWQRRPGRLSPVVNILVLAGLIVPPDPSTNSYRQLIVELASRYRIPAIHTLRAAAVDGALMSYGVDIPSLHREAASYVDRILKGEKPADLPVQQPTKFEFVINLKTAKTLGLEVPPTLLARADEVIE